MLRHVVLLTSLFYFGILTIDRLKQSKTVFTLDLFDGRLLQGIRCVYCESCSVNYTISNWTLTDRSFYHILSTK